MASNEETTELEVAHKEQGTQFEHVIVKAGTHHVHVSQSEKGTEIYVHDHLHVTVTGEHKDMPLVTVESDEDPTWLKIVDEERSFDRLDAPDYAGSDP